jgi:hypothetical protein
MGDQITVLAKIRFKKYRESGAIELDEVRPGLEPHLTDLARKNGYTVEAERVTFGEYEGCSIVSIPNDGGGPRPYVLALINETEEDRLRAEVQRLRAEVQRLREKMDAARAALGGE